MKKLTKKEKLNIYKKLDNLKSARDNFYFNDSAIELDLVSCLVCDNVNLSRQFDFLNVSMEDLKEINKLCRYFKSKVRLFKRYTIEDYENKNSKFALIYNMNEEKEEIINLQLCIYNTLRKYASDRNLTLYNITTYLESTIAEISKQYFINEITEEERQQAEKEDLTILAKEKAKALQENFLYQKTLLLFNFCGLEYWMEELKEEKQIKLSNIERTIAYYENIIENDNKEEEEE